MTRRTALSLATVVVFGLVAAALAAVVRQEFVYGESIRYGEGRLFYTSAVTAAEAQRAGDALDRAGYWGDRTQPRHAQLDRRGDTYLFRIVAAGTVPADQMAAASRPAAAILSAEALGGAPVEVHLCDRRFRTQTVIR